MLRNILTTALRSIKNDRLNSFINITGLSVGLACAILIYFYAQNELTFDHFHENGPNIYRAYTSDQNSENPQDQFKTATSSLLGPTLQKSLPEVKAFTRITAAPCKVSLDENKFNEHIELFDSAFFDIFTFKVLKGSLRDVLDDPTNLVLSREMAIKYFGDNDPVGEQIAIKIGGLDQVYHVKAVIENPPSNSSINYGLIAPYSNCSGFVSNEVGHSWFATFGETYVLLNESADSDLITEKMLPVMKSELGDRYKEGEYNIHLQPLFDIHFGKGMDIGIVKHSDIKYLYVVTGIAMLILLLASINFTTLSIGKSFTRVKEVGIRKVIGSSRGMIIRQFLTESIMMTFFGLGIAVVLAQLVLPWFNQLAGVELNISLGWRDGAFLLFLGIVVGVFSGSYPAFLISGFQSQRILKGDFGSHLKKQTLRKSLVTVQYIIAIAFISVTILMFQQMRFLINKDLGFDKDQVITITYESDISGGLQLSAEDAIEQGEQLKKSFEQISGVASVGFCTNKFKGSSWIRVGSSEEGKEDETVMLSATFIDPGFIPTLGIELLDGRNFSELNMADYKNAVIVNESLMKELGWSGIEGEQLPGRYQPHEVVGVVKNFNYESLHKSIRPLFLTMNPNFMFEAMNQLSMESMLETNMFVKLKAGQTQSTIALLEKAARQVLPEEPFEFEFIDESIQVQYERESNLNKIISSATLLAIIVSGLGLFGLSFLTLSARTKEIGIRKTLGASFGGLYLHLVKDYIYIIIIAMIIAIPMAYYFIQQWLEEFEYRINILPQYFVLAVLVTLVISVITVSYITIRSVTRKPVDALRYE